MLRWLTTLFLFGINCQVYDWLQIVVLKSLQLVCLILSVNLSLRFGINIVTLTITHRLLFFTFALDYHSYDLL